MSIDGKKKKMSSVVCWNVAAAVITGLSFSLGNKLFSIPWIALALGLFATLGAWYLFVTGDKSSQIKVIVEGVILVLAVHATATSALTLLS